MSEAIAKLKYWLAIPGNTEAKLAHLLDYRSSVTIQQWIDRNSIPHYQIPKLMEIIDGDIIESSKKGQNQETTSGSDIRP